MFVDHFALNGCEATVRDHSLRAADQRDPDSPTQGVADPLAVDLTGRLSGCIPGLSRDSRVLLHAWPLIAGGKYRP